MLAVELDAGEGDRCGEGHRENGAERVGGAAALRQDPHRGGDQDDDRDVARCDVAIHIRDASRAA